MEATQPNADTPSQPGSEQKLVGGRLLSAISTGFVRLLREHYGRGPLKAKTYALDDIVVCVMRGSGFTPLEQTMMDSGDAKHVVTMRENFQAMMAGRYKEMIERLTNRKVLAFLSQAHIEPDITIEMFFIDRPLEGFGAVEVIDGGKQSD
ncbi:MAG TPA: Na-translocating system protein MpsC family protein [Solirubrobacteraceae bacterium]